MKKVIFLDIDGTMVDFAGNIADSTGEALQSAKANGHKLIICTGRSRYGIHDELIELGFDGIVSSDGACVIYDDKEIFHRYLDIEKRKPLFDYLETNRFAYAVQSKDGLVVNQRCLVEIQEEFAQIGLDSKQVARLFGQATVNEEVGIFPDEEKVVFNRSPFPLAQVRQDVGPDFHVTGYSLNRKEDAGEIGMAGINKAFGMQVLLDYIGVGREDTVAVGDGPNDLEMLAFAGVGVAMGNAARPVREAADFTTASITADGIYLAFKKLRLI